MKPPFGRCGGKAKRRRWERRQAAATVKMMAGGIIDRLVEQWLRKFWG